MKPTFSPLPPPDDRQLSYMLRNLPGRVPPANLTSRLMAVAAAERQRTNGATKAEPVAVATPFQKWRDRLQLSVQNMMRPMALPFAGGMFSALTLFSLWVVPAYPFIGVQGRADVPTGLSTVPKLKGTSSMHQDLATWINANIGLATVGVSGAEVVVDIIVDGDGRMVDYTIVSGASNLADPRIRSGLENLLLFAQFVPATAFGQPKAGRMRLSLSSSSINVKG